MKILYDESLKKYTSVKIGGKAENMYFPESEEELVQLIKLLASEPFYIISGGSNILINDKKVFKNVVVLTKMNTSIVKEKEGVYQVGASVRINKLITSINKEGYCGIEYLFSLPALVGGIIVMNAGRGRKFGKSISDYVEEVRVYDNGLIKNFSKEECEFSYRSSIFQDRNLIVLGAKFRFEKIDENNPEQMTRQERMSFSKAVQDHSGPSFGSVFCQQNRIIMQIVKLLGLGFGNGMGYSKKTSNWLTNKGEGTYSQAINLINKVKLVHRIIGKEAKTEVKIWE